MENKEIYLVLSHVDGTYENEFLGVFSSPENAKAFIEAAINAEKNTIGYSKITVHPVPLDMPFDFVSFNNNSVITFAKVDGKLKLV